MAFADPHDHLESFVEQILDDVKKSIDGHGDVWRQAAYQYLYALGHRIPPDPHNELRRRAKKAQSA